MRSHAVSLLGIFVASQAPALALAQSPPAAPPAKLAPASAPAPAPAGAPATKTPAKGKDKAPAPEPLPSPAVRLWIVAPSPDGPWAFRLDNEGSKPIRIPADVRLLHFEIDTEPHVMDMAEDAKKGARPAKPKKPAKPVTCSIPTPLRPEAFPDTSALLLAPGETYIESFEPRLFCFGKDPGAALAGGSVVRSWFGWEGPKKASKKGPEGPFAAEGTEYPPTSTPLKSVSAPPLVLSFAKRRPDPTPRVPGVAQVAVDPQKAGEVPAGAEPPKPGDPGKPGDATKDAAAGKDAGANKPADANKPGDSNKDATAAKPGDANKPGESNKDTTAGKDAGKAPDAGKPADAGKDAGKPVDAGKPADAGAPKPAEAPVDDDPLTRPPIVDENAPRIEISATPYLDVSAPARATITVTATNAGHRPTLVAIRPRMLGFRIDGPGGSVVRCDAAGPTHAIPREGFSSLKPGASTSMTVLLAEVCPREALRRPGLYRVRPTLYLGENGAELGLTAYTGVARVKTPTYLRLLSGPEPFYMTAPRAAPIPRPPPSDDAEGSEGGAGDGK